MNVGIIIILVILSGIVFYGLKKTKGSKKSKSNGTGGGGRIITTPDVVGPKPNNPTTPRHDDTELREPIDRDLNDFR